jgi:glycerol-3-phosphate acyltransferase PlsY
MFIFTVVMMSLVAYLLGSVSFGLLIGKWFSGIDVRQHGSGNAGATNISRVLGTGPGLVVLLLDGLKGYLPVLLALAFTDGHLTAAMLVGIAAIIGHIWPIYFGFRGGKGVATTIGVMLGISFWATLIAGAITLLVIAITRYVSLGSLLLVFLLPWLLLALGKGLAVFFLSLLLMALVFWKHRENIQRLLQGREHKFGKRVQ